MQTLLGSPKITVLKPQGHLNAANAVEFQSQLMTSVGSNGPSVLLVDMEQAESLDSAGLMALVAALSLAQRLERQLILCSVSAPIRIIFELTGLDRVFEIFENRAACESTIGQGYAASR